MNVIREIKKINQLELSQNIDLSGSWHDQYKHSAYIYVGGLPYELTEGDLICIFSQYGEIVDVNLVRDKETGKSKGFAFLAYEDQRSTVLAVDNFTGAKIAGRTLRVDHVKEYKPPKPKEGEEPTPEEILQERKRKNMILPPHLRDSDLESNASDREEEDIVSSSSSSEDDIQLPPEIAQMDPEDPMRNYMIDEWKRKQLKKRRKKKDSKEKKKKKMKKREKELN